MENKTPILAVSGNALCGKPGGWQALEQSGGWLACAAPSEQPQSHEGPSGCGVPLKHTGFLALTLSQIIP